MPGQSSALTADTQFKVTRSGGSGVGVGVGLGVGDGVAVGVVEGIGVGVTVGVPVGIGVGLNTGLGVAALANWVAGLGGSDLEHATANGTMTAANSRGQMVSWVVERDRAAQQIARMNSPLMRALVPAREPNTDTRPLGGTVEPHPSSCRTWGDPQAL